MTFSSVTMMANLTRDVNLHYTQSQVAMAKIGVAINNRRKKGDEWIEEPCYVDVLMIGKRAEAFAKFHKKGSTAIFRDAKLAYEEWEAKDGSNRNRVYVLAHDWVFPPKPRSETPF